MENPAKEVANVASLVAAAISPEVQRASVLKYYAEDASFKHPLCAFKPGPNTRANILTIYQWYRIMSPKVSVEVTQTTYNEEDKVAFMDITQLFHIRFSPFRPMPTRLIVRMALRSEPSPVDPSKTVYVISEHEDFYQPDDFAALLIPPLVPLVRLLHMLAMWSVALNVKIFQAFGFWTFDDEEAGAHDEEGSRATKSKKD